MSRYKYSKTEQQINNVLAYHEKELAEMRNLRTTTKQYGS